MCLDNKKMQNILKYYYARQKVNNNRQVVVVLWKSAQQRLNLQVARFARLERSMAVLSSDAHSNVRLRTGTASATASSSSPATTNNTVRFPRDHSHAGHGVDDRVERRVERQHKDGNPGKDAGRNGHSEEGDNAQEDDGRPTPEVSEHDEGHPPGHAVLQVVLCWACGNLRVSRRDEHPQVGAADERKGEQVQDEEDEHWVLPAAGPLVGDVQRQTDTGAAVEVVKGQVANEWEAAEDDSHQPENGDDQLCVLHAHLVDAKGKGDGDEAVDGDHQQGKDGKLAGQRGEEAGKVAQRRLPPVGIHDEVDATGNNKNNGC